MSKTTCKLDVSSPAITIHITPIFEGEGADQYSMAAFPVVREFEAFLDAWRTQTITECSEMDELMNIPYVEEIIYNPSCQAVLASFEDIEEYQANHEATIAAVQAVVNKYNPERVSYITAPEAVIITEEHLTSGDEEEADMALCEWTESYMPLGYTAYRCEFRQPHSISETYMFETKKAAL